MPKRSRWRMATWGLAAAAAIGAPRVLADGDDGGAPHHAAPAALPRIPWIVLTTRSAGAFAGRAEDGDCLGVLISPTSALTAASCISTTHFQQTPQLTAAVFVSEIGYSTKDATNGVDLPRASGPQTTNDGNGPTANDSARTHWQLIHDARIALPENDHEIDGGWDTATAPAVVSWSTPVPTAPITLDRREWRAVEEEALLVGLTAGHTHSSAIGVSALPPPDCGLLGTSVGECKNLSWINAQACSAFAKASRANTTSEESLHLVLTTDVGGGPRRLRGIVLRTASNCVNERVLPTVVTPVHRCERFIDRVSRGHAWWPDRITTGEPSPTEVNEGSSGSTVTDDPSHRPSWLMALPQSMALVNEKSTMPDEISLSGTHTLAVLVAPRILLTTVANGAAVDVTDRWRFAHFAQATYEVATVHVSNVLGKSSDSNTHLVVFELARNVDQEIATPWKILMPPPPVNRDIEFLSTTWLQESVFLDNSDPNLPFDPTRTEHILASIDMTNCGLENLAKSDDVVCIQGSAHSARFHSHRRNFTIFHSGETLIGFSLAPSSVNTELRVSQSFVRLASPEVREFIHHATNDTVRWADSDLEELLGKSRIPVVSNFARFHTNSTASATNQLDCVGIFISPQHVVTLASCLDGEHPPGWVSVEQSKPRGSRQPAKMLRVRSVDIHPEYEQSSSKQQSKQNLAVVTLSEKTTKAAIFSLYSARLSVGCRVMQINLTEYEEEPSLVAASSRCADTTNTTTCVAHVNGTLSSSACCSSREVARPSRSKPLALFHRVGTDHFLVGFSVSPSSWGPCNCPRTFVPVLENVNFINALVWGQLWGRDRDDLGRYYTQPPRLGPKPRSPTYLVGLRLTKDGQNFCGGSLIAPQYVLTAAHCIADGLARWVSVGSAESAGLNTEPIPIVRNHIVRHPLYGSPPAFSYDAAIIELAIPAYPSPIALHGKTDFPDESPARMYGYGVVEPTSTVLSSEMHIRPLSILSKQTCASQLPNIVDSILCASARNGFDACTGDSGSPLVVRDGDGNELLVGIVSAGYGCGVKGVPGLYTRVADPRIMEFIDAYAVTPTWRHRSHWASPPPPPSPSSSTTEASDRPSTTSPSPTDQPLKQRDAQPPTPSASGGRSSGSSDPLPPPRQFDAAVSATEVVDLRIITKKQLAMFLFGERQWQLLPMTVLRALVSTAENALVLFSAGDVSRILALLRQHDERPLNRRADRFQTAAQRTRAPTTAHCIP